MRNSIDQLSNYKTAWAGTSDCGTVIYQETKIVDWDDRGIILETDGYKTVTTKKKMNQTSNQFNLGFKVFQKNHEWFVTTDNGTFNFDDDRIIIERV